MSILDQQPTDIIPLKFKVANQLLNLTLKSFTNIINVYHNSTILFWQNPQGVSPSDIADALGDRGKEMFELHYKLGQLLNSIDPKYTEEFSKMIGSFNLNEDGTVTVNFEEHESEIHPEIGENNAG